MSLPQTIYTNKASLMGSLYWNLNSSLGFLLGSPSDDDVFTYSDLVTDEAQDGGMQDYITSVPSNSPFASSLSYNNTTRVWTVSQEEYEKGDWFLFGSTALPWFPPPSDGNGEYLRRNNNSQISSYNKLRMDVLTPTLMTAAKLGLPMAAVAAGGYFGYKKYYK
jgi:hypothetical protein